MARTCSGLAEMITIGYPPYTVKRYMYLHEELILADEFIGIHVNLIQIQVTDNQVSTRITETCYNIRS